MSPDYLLLQEDRRTTLLHMLQHGHYDAWRNTLGGSWCQELVAAGLATLVHIEDKTVTSLTGEMKNSQWCTWTPTEAAYKWLL